MVTFLDNDDITSCIYTVLEKLSTVSSETVAAQRCSLLLSLT